VLSKFILSLCINIKHVLHQCRSKGDDDMNTPRANNDYYYKKQINVWRKFEYQILDIIDVKYKYTTYLKWNESFKMIQPHLTKY